MAEMTPIMLTMLVMAAFIGWLASKAYPDPVLRILLRDACLEIVAKQECSAMDVYLALRDIHYPTTLHRVEACLLELERDGLLMRSTGIAPLTYTLTKAGHRCAANL